MGNASSNKLSAGGILTSSSDMLGPRLFGQVVGGFGDAFELWLALEVQEDSRLFDEAALEDALDNFVAVQGLAGLAEDFADDVGHGALLVTPLLERVDAAPDEHEALVFDQFVVNGLGGDVLALEIAVLDGRGDFVEVHVFAVFLENNVNLVADILGVDHRPLDQAPTAVQGGQVLGGAGQRGSFLGIGQAGGFGDRFDVFWL